MLVDTSVWIDHFRHSNAALTELLEESEVWVHPFVVGELACGNPTNRLEILRLLQALPRTPLADHDEVLGFLESHSLMGSGIGWVDAHLLASVRLGGIGLWTLDRALAAAAAQVGVATRTG